MSTRPWNRERFSECRWPGAGFAPPMNPPGTVRNRLGVEQQGPFGSSARAVFVNVPAPH
jgi:hypothetical protein